MELASGDLFVFGGPSRFAYHGVPKVYPGTADPATGMSGGRLNITLRETGLSGTGLRVPRSRAGGLSGERGVAEQQPVDDQQHERAADGRGPVAPS